MGGGGKQLRNRVLGAWVLAHPTPKAHPALSLPPAQSLQNGMEHPTLRPQFPTLHSPEMP